ncbi:MAG: hypothetical protein R6U03_02740 [Gillisia sp.]
MPLSKLKRIVFTGDGAPWIWRRVEELISGSGSVESAIRRVINLRLKSPGSFWLKDGAERFLFLRSQLISGRWNIFMANVNNRIRKYLDHEASSIDQENVRHKSVA